MMNILEIGQKTLQDEATGIMDMARILDENFEKAVEILKSVRGRIVVTGMGKSGHIGRKIAATLASVGSTAYYVHPGEANHGDLGMIANGDVVLAISNSGETPELFNLLHYCKRHNDMRIIAITSGEGSTLDQASDVTILLPKGEACPLGLVPTTSTTITLALGDALAVAVYSETLTAKDFGKFHPGGTLGRDLLTVREIMHTGDAMPIIHRGSTLKDAIVEITNKALGCVAVIDKFDSKLVGILTDGDIRRHLTSDTPLDEVVDDIMTTMPKTTTPDVFAAETLSVMNNGNITSLFVLDGDKCPIGVLHIHDCLRAGLDS